MNTSGAPSKPVRPAFLSGYRPYTFNPWNVFLDFSDFRVALRFITLIYWMFVVIISYGHIAAVYQASDWVKTPCALEATWIAGKEGAYGVGVRFSYHDAKGKKHTAEGYQFRQKSSKTKAPVIEIIDELRKAKKSFCFVNPSFPKEAILRKGGHACYWLIALGLLVGILLLPLIRWLEFQRPKSDLHLKYWKEVMADLLPVDFAQAGHGPMKTLEELRPERLLMYCLAFALLGLGIWAGAVIAQDGDDIDIPAQIALGILALPVALKLAVLVARLRNQVPKITVPNPVRQAMPFAVEWNFPDKARLPDSFQIRLEGRVKIWRLGPGLYGHSKQNTIIRKSKIFQTIPVVKAANERVVSLGSQDVVIPLETMHSLDGHRNAILWSIVVESKSGVLPGLVREYPIKALPAAYGKGEAE